MKNKYQNTTLRIYTPYVSASGMLLHINRKFVIGTLLKDSDSSKNFPETDLINILIIMQLIILWISTVILFLLSCSVIRMKPTSYRTF